MRGGVSRCDPKCQGRIDFGSIPVLTAGNDDDRWNQAPGRNRVARIANSMSDGAARVLENGYGRTERLRILLDLSQTYRSSAGLREMLRQVVGKLRTGMACDLVSISLPNLRDGKLYTYAVDSGSSISKEKEGDSAAREVEQAFHSGKPVQLRADGLCFECHVPIDGATVPNGVLSVFWRRSPTPLFGTPEFLSGVAQHLSIAIEREMDREQIHTLKGRMATETLRVGDEARIASNFDGIIGQSVALTRVLRQIEMVAPTDSTVLVYGETGTGKELIAQAIHRLSTRSRAPFVKLNCAAIPTGLLESELFGHERGAFTGAIAQRIGRFELANRGTVFLDEIGEIPLELQPKLLRVLQEREFERLGNSRTLSTDARLVAATNRDLTAMVAEGKFRADLYYRLNVFPVTVPSLTQRKDDIPLLVRSFIRRLSRRMHKTIEMIPEETMAALTKYHWPGNIREMQNVLERAVILSTGTVLKLSVSDLPEMAQPAVNNEIDTLENTERKHILRALGHTKGVVAGRAGAAALLGLKRTTLQTRMQRLGLTRQSR